MRTNGVKQSETGTKKDDFRHKVAHRFDRVSYDMCGTNGKKIGSPIGMMELAFPVNMSKASLSTLSFADNKLK